MIEDSKQNLSALDKVKQMKAQKEQERKEAEELIKKQEQEKIQSAETMYTKLQNDLADLELQKKDLESQMKDQKREKVSIRKSQEAATAEIFSDKDVVEEVFQGEGKIKDNQTLKDIFAEDEEKVSSIDKTIKELKDQIKATEESIEITKLQAQETYKQTPKGIEEIEKQKAEQEAAEKAVQEKIKKEERIKINQVLGVNVKNQSNEFFKTGILDLYENDLRNADQQFGKEKVKEIFNELIDEQIQDVLNAERNKWGANEIKEQLDRYDAAKKEYDFYKNEYPRIVNQLKNELSILKEISKEIGKMLTEKFGNDEEFKNTNFNENAEGFISSAANIDNNSLLNQLLMGNYTDISREQYVIDSDSLTKQIDSLKSSNNAALEYLKEIKSAASMDELDKKHDSLMKKFGAKVQLKDVRIYNPTNTTIKFNAFDSQRYQQLGYQGVNQYDRDRQSRIEKTATIDQARQLLVEGEEKVTAKEKAMKEVANAQFEQKQLIIEAKEKFNVGINSNLYLEDQERNYNYHQEKLKTIYTQVIQKSAQLETMKDAEIANHGGSIIFKQNQELNNSAKETDEQLTQEKGTLTTERYKLQNEISKATFGIGNKPREKRIVEIDNRITEINNEKVKLESEIRSRSMYMEVGQILKELNIDTAEIMTGVRTAGELMKKLQEKILEDQQIPFDPLKKEYLQKLNNAQALVDQKKRAFVDMNSK